MYKITASSTLILLCISAVYASDGCYVDYEKLCSSTGGNIYCSGVTSGMGCSIAIGQEIYKIPAAVSAPPGTSGHKELEITVFPPNSVKCKTTWRCSWVSSVSLCAKIPGSETDEFAYSTAFADLNSDECKG